MTSALSIDRCCCLIATKTYARSFCLLLSLPLSLSLLSMLVLVLVKLKAKLNAFAIAPFKFHKYLFGQRKECVHPFGLPYRKCCRFDRIKRVLTYQINCTFLSLPFFFDYLFLKYHRKSKAKKKKTNSMIISTEIITKMVAAAYFV